MEENDTLSAASTLDVLSDDAAVGPIVRLAALAHALDAPGAPAPSRTDLRDGLAALGAAEPALERAALVVTAHARAAGLTWSEIADVHGGRPDALARRHTRRRERFTNYVPPLAPTLEAYTSRAADLLAPVLAERSLSPFLARLAAERLGAVLLTAHWEQVDAVGAASWLSDDALSEPRQRLHHQYGDQVGAVRGVLNAHGQDPGPVQASLVELMRVAVGADDLIRHLHPVHPGPLPAWAVSAADTGSDAPAALPSAETGLDVDALVAIDGGVGVLNVAVDHDGGRVKPGRAAPKTLRRLRDARLVDADSRITDRGRAALPLATDQVTGRVRSAGSGYAPVLMRAGLDQAAAAALTAPLAAFTATVERVKDQQQNGELRGVLHSLAPVLSGGDPARVRLLLGTLPHLNLAGLEDWAALALAMAEHAPHLDERTDTAALAEGAGLPSGAARPLAELVDAARLPVLASYAPGAPASAVADDLAAVIVAVDTANVSDLPAVVDLLVQAERLDLDTDQPHRLTRAWEDLVYALTDGNTTR
ncbi:hypothetical protein [Nocardiopsis tropica]|uniref:Uncharacterized protein n=1 Tax=Nocardiopsis tropica TaxID=109330 RepID=A0ABU7KT44_9ACTN|nr:hypothetical protein [Nocardiopsis umidischolae]MEE2051822.1 hypothetical protein [Nocardiopsis umidischolae]